MNVGDRIIVARYCCDDESNPVVGEFGIVEKVYPRKYFRPQLYRVLLDDAVTGCREWYFARSELEIVSLVDA